MHEFVKAALILRKEAKYLLTKERIAWKYGPYNWVQGHLEEGETPEEAAMREAREETGREVRIIRKLAVLGGVLPDTKEIHVFLGELEDGELIPQASEVSELRFVSFAELEAMRDELMGPWVYEAIEALEREEGLH